MSWSKFYSWWFIYWFSRLDKKEKVTKNPKNEDDKCFQYAITVELSYGKIGLHPERVSNIKPFSNKCNCQGINYPSKIDEWETFEKNNPTIAPNILYIKEKEICPVYISKIHSNCERQIKIRMALCCSKKIICSITWNNFET